jgi:prolyl-tRNA synthetase
MYEELQSAGLEVLYDDREDSAGVKLNDADLLGLPVRVVVSPRNLKQGEVEVKARSASEATMVAADQVVPRVREILDSATAEAV